MGTKEEKGTLRQLVAEKGIDEVYPFSQICPTDMHEYGSQERQPYVKPNNNAKDQEPIFAEIKA